MWTYEKKLQYPVKIACPNARLAKVIMSQFGGSDGETAAALRYLSQRFAMPCKEGIATLTDVGTEELAHLEIICAIIHQLTRDLTIEEIKAQGFDDYYVDHTLGIWPQAAGGVPFSSTFFQSKGDPITDLHEDMAAEQKARTTYDNILRLTDDPDVLDPIRFLRAREIVHFQRFGETLRIMQDHLDNRNFYAFNPAFDRGYTRAFACCPISPAASRCSADSGSHVTHNESRCAADACVGVPLNTPHECAPQRSADPCECPSHRAAPCDSAPRYKAHSCDCASQYSADSCEHPPRRAVLCDNAPRYKMPPCDGVTRRCADPSNCASHHAHEVRSDGCGCKDRVGYNGNTGRVINGC